MINYKLIADPDHQLSYGYWYCPECKNKFAGGGRAIHKDGCSKSDYDGLTYYYSSKEVERWNQEVTEKGCCANLPLSPNGLADHLLKTAIAQDKIDVQQVKDATTKYVESIKPDLLPRYMEMFDELIAEAAVLEAELEE